MLEIGHVCGAPEGVGEVATAADASRQGDSEIFVMNADGTNVRQLTNNDHTNE